MTTPTFVNFGQTTGGFTHTVTGVMPASIVAGNLLIGYLSLSLQPGDTPVWPAGWNVISFFNTARFTVSVAYKIAVGGDAAPIVTWVDNTNVQLTIAQYSGTHATSPVGNVTANPFTTSGGSTAISGTPVTTASANATVASFVFLNNGGSVSVAPSVSWTNRILTTGSNFVMYDTPMVSAGAAPTFAFTFSSSVFFDVVEIEIASAIPPVTGTMGPTEATDTFAATGGSFPTGTMGPTEAKDTWTTPPFGRMGATEAHDTFAGTAYAQVIGSMGATEARDTYHMAGGAVPDLTLDAFATGHAETPGGGPPPTTVSATISTAFPDDVIVVMVANGGFWNYNPILGIADTAGLTWHRRARRPSVTSEMVAKEVEIWWAHAPTPLSADVITVTTTGGTGQLGMNVVAVAGANFSAPWDVHPYANQWNNRKTAGASIETGFASTNAAKTMTLLMSSGASAQSAANTGVPYTFLGTVNSTESAGLAMNVGSAYSINGTALDHSLAAFGPGGNSNFFSDSIVQAGQTGTADEVLYWIDGFFWDFAGTLLWPSNVSIFSGANGTVQCNLTTSSTNEIVMAVVQLFSAGGAGTVSSVADSAGLASGWTRRSRETSPDGKLALEVWYAVAPAVVTGMAISAHTTNTVAGDYAQILTFGVVGATYFYDGVLWDGHPSLPDVSTYISAGTALGQVVTGMSTINMNTLDLGFMANIDSTAPFQPAPGGAASYPDALGPFANTNSPNSSMGVLFKFSDVPLASDLMASNVSSKEWVVIGDALPVGPPQPPVGVWGSHEGVDIWSAAGFVPAFGTMNPTEAKDTTGGAPNIAPFTGVGWFGWVPAFATVGFTDSQDRAVVEGWVIGAPLTGVMGPTESKDRAALSNRATVTGTMGLTELRDRVASSGFEIPKALPAPPRKRRVLIVS